MSKFRLPLISPLAGARLTTLGRVLRGNRVAPRYYVKMGITMIVVLLGSALQCIDRMAFARKVNKFVIKKSPLFIIGHWRSGTTLLHNLLTRDPTSGHVSTYQAVFPNNLKSKWLFKNFMRFFMPDERPGDRMKISVDHPQEDEYAMSNTTHRSFYHFFYFPTTYRSLYKKYIRFDSLDEEEQEEWKLKYRKLVIKALINTGGQRAILKNPVNTARMRPISQIFPGANYVYLIRNPLIVYLSTKKFFGELFPTVNLESFTEEDLIHMILDVYNRLLCDYLADKLRMNSKKIFELRYEAFIVNPILELEKIYDHFAYGDFQELKPDFQAYLDTLNGHMKDSYVIDQKELDLVLEKLDFAMKHWNYGIPEDLTILNRKNKKGKKALVV